MTATANVERLSSRLAAAPAPFRGPVDHGQGANVRLHAVVADLFRDRATRPATSDELAPFVAAPTDKSTKRHQLVVLVATWLLYDDAFYGADASRLASLLRVRLSELSRLVLPRALVEDAERREELVRVCLDALRMAPFGEAPADAEDRLATLDSVRHASLLRAAKEREAARERERKKQLEALRLQEEEARRQAARATHED